MSIPPTDQPFVPFTVTETDWKEIHAWLNEQPMKFGVPVAQWLSGLQQRAMASEPDDIGVAMTKQAIGASRRRKR